MSNLNPKNFWLPVNFCVLGMGLRALRSITWVKSRNIVVLTIIPKKQSIYVLATISLLSHYHNFLFLTLTNFFSKLYLLIYPEKCILIWINLIWNKYFSIVVFTQLNFIFKNVHQSIMTHENEICHQRSCKWLGPYFDKMYNFLQYLVMF